MNLTELVETFKESIDKAPKPFDTTAEVVRIEDETAWVQIPGSDDETPVNLTIAAKEGDNVQVRVSGGNAFLVGNASAPPTDDATAIIAQGKAEEAVDKAAAAQDFAEAVEIIATEAKTIADNTDQYFWVNSTGDDTGAHITEVTQDDWNNSSSPNYHSGGNLLARSNGIAVRDGLTELASFGATGSRIGINTQAHVDIDYHSLALKRKEGGSYFVVQDLRNQSGQYSATDVFTGNGSKKIYSLTYPAANTSYTVTVSDSSGGTVTKGENDVEFSTAPTNGATITVSYTTTTPTTIALTFGDRAYGSTLGGYSSVLGYDAVASGFASHALNSGTVAASDDQTAIGTYNEVDSGHKYAFIIGNGSDDDERSNALTVDWHGNVEANNLVTNVAYDSTNAKITETINGNTSDVVTVATLSTALGIGDKLNKTNGEETSDLNNCKTAGFYTFTKDASNIPFTSGGGVGGSLLVMRFSSTYIYQVAFANNNSNTSTAAQLRIYARRYYNGTWYAWYKFTLS